MKILFAYTNINGFHYDNYHFGVGSLVQTTVDLGHEVNVKILTTKNDYREFEIEILENIPDRKSTRLNPVTGEARMPASALKKKKQRGMLDSTMVQWAAEFGRTPRSEEHTSELQSHLNLVCRLPREKKKTTITHVGASINIVHRHQCTQQSYELAPH